jgi:hypothetical protein
MPLNAYIATLPCLSHLGYWLYWRHIPTVNPLHYQLWNIHLCPKYPSALYKVHPPYLISFLGSGCPQLQLFLAVIMV